MNLNLRKNPRVLAIPIGNAVSLVGAVIAMAIRKHEATVRQPEMDELKHPKHQNEKMGARETSHGIVHQES